MHSKLPSVEPAKLIDVESVASMLGVSKRHVYRLADAGQMPKPIKLGGAVRWSRKAINDWILAGCPRIENQRGDQR